MVITKPTLTELAVYSPCFTLYGCATAASKILLPPRERSCEVAHNVTFSFCSEPPSLQTGCFNVTISPKVNVENRWARGSEPKGSFRGETGHGTIWKELSSWRGRENCIPWQERHASRKPEWLCVRPLSSAFFWAPLMHHAFCSVQVFTDIISFNPRGFQRNKTSAWARPVACSRSNSKELWDTPF